MDAHALPVLSRWTRDEGRAAAPAGGVPAGLATVDGFAGSATEALARAAERFPGRDVLVMHADAVLPAFGWDRLQAAWHDGAWDVLSPLDRGWALAWPDGGDADAIAWTRGEHATFATGTVSDTCALWRANAIDSPSPRAGLLPCLVVDGHATPRGDMLPPPLQRLQAAIADDGSRSPAPPRDAVVLHVLHAWGGGVERFARDLAAADTARTHLCLVAHNDADLPPFGRRLSLYAQLDAPPLATWELAAPIPSTGLTSPEVAAVLADIVARWQVGAVLVSSLVGHALDVLRTGLPTAVCLHDAYPLWPLLHDSRDASTAAFDDDALAAGLAAAGKEFVFPSRDPSAWRALRDATLVAYASPAITLVAPSDEARTRVLAISPSLAARPVHVLPHGLAPFPRLPALPTAGRGDGPLRVLVPGRLHGGKGEALVAALLAQLPAGVELVLLGCGHAGDAFADDARVQVVRDYRRDELPAWIERLAPDLALLPSTLHETFGYTLSEMLALGLPVLSASPGAPARRLPPSRGWVLPPDAAAIAALLAQLAADRDAVAAKAAPARNDDSLAAMAAAWRTVLPTTPGALRLPPAGTDAARLLTVQAQASALAADVAQLRPALADAWRELDARAAWAHDLQASLATRESAAAGLQATVRQLEDYVDTLDHQLAESHGYYQRDSTDLARQRDVALAQRDALSSQLDMVRRSLWWRMSSPMRGLARWLADRRAGAAYRLRTQRALVARGLASLRTRGVAATWRKVRERRQVQAQAPQPALPTPTAAGASALRLPRPAQPRASIVVPVYNQLQFSLACLRALADCGDTTSFEVIVVDDGSSDATPRVLPSVPGLRYHRNARNLGFIGACNAGAELARGDFIVFLNNDTTVAPGWLDALLRTFDDHPDTGLAGSKLVYPDGRLQEAGGIVFSDGSGWNYGRFDDPAHPRYNFVREVDYCSGAAIALRRELFLSLGGFDDLYAPAYYEDTDLAMRVRRHGLKVRYQPASVVVHHEGVTSGTDVGSGTKAYQVVNQRKFVARWQDVLRATHPSPSMDPAVAADRGTRTGGRRVLVLDACTPTPDRDSGSVRMLALMRVLRDEGCSVVFFAENRAHDGAYTEALQQGGIEAWWHPYLADVPAWLQQHGAAFDLVVGSRHYVLAPLLPLLRRHAPRARIVFDTVDLHHLRELREAELSGDAAQRRAAERTRRIELDLIARSDTTWVVSPAERDLLAAEMPDADVAVVSNVHDARGHGLPPAQRDGLLFVGSYRHPPNVDAVRWLVGDILPRIHARLPGVTLHLVGGDAPDDIVALGESEGVRFHGFVPDLLPLLDGARVALAPLRYGAGVKGKVNQSLAHGQPVVATTCAVEGMHLRDGEDVLVADDAQAFADAVVRLHEDEALWQRLADGGLENTRRHFSSDTVRATLRALLASLPPR